MPWHIKYSNCINFGTCPTETASCLVGTTYSCLLYYINIFNVFNNIITSVQYTYTEKAHSPSSGVFSHFFWGVQGPTMFEFQRDNGATDNRNIYQ